MTTGELCEWQGNQGTSKKRWLHVLQRDEDGDVSKDEQFESSFCRALIYLVGQQPRVFIALVYSILSYGKHGGWL